MKCKRCRDKAEVQLRHHNAAFCRRCFVVFFQRQVQRAIDKERMFTPQEPVLVAVSGGKDSLALWDVLIDLGYQTAGVHLDLGIGEYSHVSTAKTEAFAQRRSQRLITVTLADEGASLPTMAALPTGRRVRRAAPPSAITSIASPSSRAFRCWPRGIISTTKRRG